MLTEEEIFEIGTILEHNGFSDFEVDVYLEHYGVLGMKWGVRKERKVAKNRRKEIAKEERKKADARAEKEAAPLIKKANALASKYNLDADDGGGHDGSPAAKKAQKTYMDLGEKIFAIEEKQSNEAAKRISERLIKEFGEERLKELRVRHDIYLDEAFLAHYGVKGMRWGVRKDRDGVSRKTDREARKDATEYARAKMYYGEGAGTRRKLINKSVEAKKAKNPNYAKAFDRHLAEQDMSTHASKARKERKRTDRKDRTKKQAGYVARRITGEMGTQAAFAAVVLAGGAYLASPKVRQKTAQVYSKTSEEVRRRGQAFLLRRRLKL